MKSKDRYDSFDLKNKPYFYKHALPDHDCFSPDFEDLNPIAQALGGSFQQTHGAERFGSHTAGGGVGDVEVGGSLGNSLELERKTFGYGSKSPRD